MKRLFTRLGLFGLLWVSALASYGQSVSLAISPSIICLNQNVQVYAMLSGVNTADVTSYSFYWNDAKTDSTYNDLSTGTPPKNNAYKLYTVAGAYKIGVVVRFSNRSDLTYDIWDTVYNPPTANVALTSLDSQCYKGNSYCFLNNSTLGSFPSLPLSNMTVTYGDGDSASMLAGGSICHSYTKGNSLFQVSVRATDVGGCWAKTFMNVFVAPNIDAAFAVSGIPKCDTTPYIFVNNTPVSPSSLLWFRWDYGDGDTFMSSIPPIPSEVIGPGNKWSGFTHYYTKSGVFDPILTVKHRYYNCTDQFVYSQSNNPLPENIVIRYDIRSRRSIGNDTIADSVCNANLNVGAVCLYNMYPLQGVNTQIQILWDFADPNNPIGSDKIPNNPTPCYTYFPKAMGQYFPSLYVGCPGKPVKRLNFWSRIDTAKASDSQYVPPPIANPRLNTINGYMFSATDCISQYRDIYTVAGGWKSVASADPSTEEFTLPAHGFANGDSVKFTVTGSVSGITNCNTYYVQSVTSTTFKLALTPTGPPVNINLLNPPYVAPLMGKIDTVVFDSIVQYWKWFNKDYSKINYTKTRPDLQGFGINILGPLVQVEDPPAFVTMLPFLKNQCGPDLPVEFTNATNLYQSNNLYIRWDFADEYAPKCTSFSVPKPGSGFEPYSTANDMTNRTLGRFIVDGVIYPGRVNCNYNHDTLPTHSYTNWNNVLNWYKAGHDFPPFDSSANGWTTDPLQVTWPGPNPAAPTGKKLVHPFDTSTWGKPMYSAGPTPSRIDTLTRMWPADMPPNQPITLRGDIPDPIANLMGHWQYLISAGHRVDTGSLFIFPNDLSKLPNGALRRYRGNTPLGDGTTNTLYDYFFKRTITASYTVRLYMKDSFNNQSDDPYKSFTRINMVNGKIIIQQKTDVPPTVIHQTDTFSYTSTPPSIVNDTLIYNYKAYPLYTDNSTVPATKYVLIRDDEFFVDYFDCGKVATLTLPLVGVDAYGLGLDGKICPGYKLGASGGDPKIHFGPTATKVKNAGTYPTGNQRTYLLFNYDSLQDRHDATPCALDGFVQFDGTSPMFTPPQATTPGGTRWPPFNNAINFNGLTVWQTITGATNNTHYLPNGPWPFSNSPISPDGFVTVGLIIGSGCATFACNAPACISDTVWYHNFMQFISLEGTFTYKKVGGNSVYGNPARLPSQDFTYDQTNKEPWSRLYGKGDIFEFETYLLKQDYVKADIWDWGDLTLTVDSFYRNPNDTFIKKDPIGNPNDSTFYAAGAIPYDRVRYEFYTETSPWTIISQSIPYPVGVNVLDTFHYDTIWQCWDLTHSGAPQSVTKVYTRIDTAFFIRPVRHQYNLSSWEMKAGPGSPAIKGDITQINHILLTTTECENITSRQIVIGVMDTFMIKDNDAILCVGETGYFTDSVRYWYPKDDGVHNPSRPLDIGEYPLLSGYQTGFNPLTYWGSNTFDRGMDNYPNDTIKLWPNATKGGKIDTFYYERIYWDFESDGVIDYAGINPSHKFSTPGRFKVSMISRDTVGYYDTCFMFVDVVKPVANFTSKSIFQCSDPTKFFDSSYIIDDCFVLTGTSCDQISVRHWWFGDNGFGPNAWRSEVKDPLYPYRKNGWYRVQESILTAQGCVDTVRKDIFINGPRPRIKLLNDTLGCTPYTIRVVTYPNDSGGTTTGATQIFSGRADGIGDNISTNNPDTFTITYNKEGVYYLRAIGWDKFPANDCPPIHVPDTVDGVEKPIRIIVKDPYRVNVEVSKQQVCVGEIFQVWNFSNWDTTTRIRRDTITKYRMYLYNQDFTNIYDTLFKTNFIQDTAWKYHLTSAGIYKIVLHSTRMMEGMPQCASFDTTTVQARKAKAGLKIDELGMPKFHVWNESDSANASGYEWTIYDPDGEVRTKVIVPDNASQFYHLGPIDFKNDTGEFKICIKAVTNNLLNCDDSVCKTVINNFQTEITIPNVFTPNADEVNDVFNIKIKGEELYELKIWNRWGGVVFESTDSQKMWNGRTQNTGAENPEGTYYYVFKYRLRGKTDQLVRGTITLIRD